MINTIDLFAGCGGLTDGFKYAGGYRSIAAVEWENWPCATLRNRLTAHWGYEDAETSVIRFDIQRTKELFEGWEGDPTYDSHQGLNSIVNNRKVDLIIGGPPCQAYSIAGRVRDKNGMQDDYRNFLFEAFMDVVGKYQPRAFVFENVEGMLSAKPGGVPIVDRIKKAFEEKGYQTVNDLRKHALLNAADFGVPQNRKRVIILGIRKNAVKSNPSEAILDFYENILPSHRKQPTVTVGKALEGLPPLLPKRNKNGEKPSHHSAENSVPNHTPRYHSKRDQRIFRELAQDVINGRVKYPNAQALVELYRKETGKESRFHKHHVLESKKPSTTIPAHLYKDGLRHIHPDPKQARSITPREAARLQGFDDSFIFLGASGEQYKMIGNAVPPPLGKAVGAATKEFFKKYMI
jgi:DNA (cytosine-5)-methyltransferase 1